MNRNNGGKYMPILLGGQALISGLAIQNDILNELGWDYSVNLPVIKWFFHTVQNIKAWGMESVFVIAGLVCMFWLVKDHPLRKNPWVRGLALFFGICTVFGRSYYDLGNWNYIFQSKLQLLLSCFVIMGYYLLYKNTFLLLLKFAEKWKLFRNTTQKRVEKWVFESHPFWAPFLVIAVCGIPVMISFFPGTMQADSYASIWTYLGNPAFQPWTAQQPVTVTWLLGKCLELSRTLFGEDNFLAFFYAGPQMVVQWFVFAYGMYVLSRMRSPFFLRWCALAYFSLFPLWKIQGYTVVKDSYYYIFSLLVIAVFVHIMIDNRVLWWQGLLLAVGSAGITLTRKNGLHVMVLFILTVLILYRKYWKMCAVWALATFLCFFSVEGILMEQYSIQPGPVKEMLSIPLQQTARYVREHYDEITEEEMTVLSQMFTVEVDQLAELYNPEISDPVKMYFVDDPSAEELQAYFKVWFTQLRKHPDTYIQAYLNHTYGYFYPDRETFQETIGRYYISPGYHYRYKDDYIEMEFAIKNTEWRNFFIKEADLVFNIPLVGMLYSCGFHNYILICCMVYLLANKRYRELAVLAPSVLTVLICLISPVDAYLRYMLPVMAVMPLNIAWCWSATAKDDNNTPIFQKGTTP